MSVTWCATRQIKPGGKVICLPWASRQYRKKLLDETPNGGCPKWHEEMVEADFDIDAFPALVEGKTVAVVGNAPTAAQFEHAATIDAAEVVIRFNRFTLDPAEVGRKTDVIALPACYGPAYPSRAMLERTKPALILLVPPKLDGIEHYLARIDGFPHGLIPIEYFGDLTRETGCRPTTGLAVICYLLDRCKPQSIYLTGFSFSRLPRGHYFNASGFNYDVHDPVKDLHTYARRHDAARVEVDPHIQRILYTAHLADGAHSMPQWARSRIARDTGGDDVIEVGPNLDVAHPCEVGLCMYVADRLPPVEVHQFLKQLSRRCRRVYFLNLDRRTRERGGYTPYGWALSLRAANWKLVRPTEVSDGVALSVADAKEDQ